MRFKKTFFTDDLFLILMINFLQPALMLFGGTELPPVWQAVRAVLGLGYVLFIPGYCLQAAAFPSRSELDRKERLALSLGLSLAILPSLALILDRLPWRINLQSVTAGLFITILVMLLAAVIRRRSVVLTEQITGSPSTTLVQQWRSMHRGVKIAYGLLGVVLLIGGFTAFSIVMLPKPAERMTEFYFLGSEGKAEWYPWEAESGQPVAITLGLRNREGQAETYRVVIQDGTGSLWESQQLAMPDGASIEQAITFTPREIGEDVEIYINLYREGQSDPYRILRLLLKVKSAP
jgi:uncharacterized membrane protein